MNTQLILQPIHSSSADILQCFALGKPLSAEQLNFLEWHQKQLSNALFDPVLSYYLKTYRKHHYQKTSFLLPHEEINLEAIQQLKKRLQIQLSQKKTSAVIKLTQKQYLQFKKYTAHDLIFWHGNQFLTGAPYYPSSTPPVIYFQWGNFFGIVKYVVLAEEKSLKANILIYFEDLQDRNIDQCIADYNHHLQNDIQHQQHVLAPQEKIIHEHEANIHQPPQLKLSHLYFMNHLHR